MIKGFWYPQPPKLGPCDYHMIVRGPNFGLGLPISCYCIKRGCIRGEKGSRTLCPVVMALGLTGIRV